MVSSFIQCTCIACELHLGFDNKSSYQTLHVVLVTECLQETCVIITSEIFHVKTVESGILRTTETVQKREYKLAQEEFGS